MWDLESAALQVSVLARIASYLCSAYEELATLGCEASADDILSVLTAIDGTIARLEAFGEDFALR
jgi:hypothetical protein